MKFSALLVVTILLINVYIVSSTPPEKKDCKTTEDYSSESSFIQFFDECFLDTTTVNPWYSIASQFQDWFRPELYPVYTTIVIFVITLLFFSETISGDDAAKGNCVRLQAIVMLMRLGLVISMIPWLWAALSQERPCECRTDVNDEYTPLILTWGMPSGTSFAATVIASHISQYMNIPLGIIFLLLACGSALVTGEYSAGQVIVGILFGVAIYVYTSRTPIFVRAADLVMTVIAGLITLFVTKAQYPAADFSFAVYFFVGIAWQLYAFVLVLLTYEWDFVRVAIRRSSHNLHPVDFMYYRPLNSPPSDREAAQYPGEAMWITIATVVLFLVMCGLSIAAQFLGNLFSV